MLSDSPPERDMEWTDAGIDGASRFCQRAWRLISEIAGQGLAPDAPLPAAFGAEAMTLRRRTHKGIEAVTADIERFHFNGAVARLYELINALAGFKAKDEGDRWAAREAAEVFTRLVGPMTPHLAEELWQTLGHADLLADTPWPEADPALTIDEEVTVAVQVNGKLRATIALPRDAEKQQAEDAALAEPAVQRALEARSPRKVIVVPNRVVNVVV